MRKPALLLLLATTIVGCAATGDEPVSPAAALDSVDAPGAPGANAQAIINPPSPQRSAAAYTEAVLVQVNNPALDYCSGVLIAPQVVLTAAHCIIFNQQAGHTWSIIAPFAPPVGGVAQMKTATSGEPMDPASYMLTLANYDMHPELHDLGLIYLPTPFTGVNYPDVSPTRYPLAGPAPAVSAVGRAFNGRGAGLALSPLAIPAPRPVSTVTLSSLSSPYTFDNVTQRITTDGDSGGPLFLEGTHTLVGTETRYNFQDPSAAGQIDYWARLDDSADSQVYSFLSNRVAAHGGWPIDFFRKDVATALCTAVSSCCAVATPGYVRNDVKCHAIYEQFGFEATARNIQTSRPYDVGIDSATKDACLQKIASNTTNCDVTSVEVKAAITFCLTAVTGKLASGASCTSSLECAGSAVCEQNAAGAGTCQTLHGSGQSCEILNKAGTSVAMRDNLAQDLCSKRGGGTPGLYCNTVDAAGAYVAESSWTCQSALADGLACNTDSYCSSFVCDPGTLTCAANASFVNANVCSAFAGP